MTLGLAILGLLLASPGSEIVIVLDNSASMAVPYSDSSGHQYPPNDPERAAVLGTLMVEGLAKGSDDRVSVILFGQGRPDPTPVVKTEADEIRQVPYVGGTFFRKPLQKARSILEGSAREGRIFVIFTDGMPEDLQDPAEGPRLLGLDVHPDWDSIAIGLYADNVARSAGETILTPLARTPDSLVFLQNASGVVAAFTRAYARSLGSRPEVGTLSPGQNKSIEVGRYVTEVMITLASTAPGDPFHATLTGPSGSVPAQAQGDNGCPPRNALANAPTICSPPRRHYQVFRAPNDPDRPSKWTLALGSGGASVEYGVILRYELRAELNMGSTARVGEGVRVKTRLVFRGKTFDDPSFFESDGFNVSAMIGGQSVNLARASGGEFSGVWTPAQPTQGVPVSATATFRNAWLEKRATAQVNVEGFVDLSLRPSPDSIDLGTWRGERKATRRCAFVDLAGSLNADRVPVACTPASAPKGVSMSCQPLPLAPGGAGPAQPLRWQVCAEAEGCCAAVDAGPVLVHFAGVDPHYASRGVDIPVRFRVQPTGFVRCWWIWLTAATASIFSVWFVAGWVRPFDFDPTASIRIASKEIGLQRAEGQILQELPGGRRGFYRNARICLDSEGEFHRSPRAAALVVEAGPAGLARFKQANGVVRKEPRSGKWAPLTLEQLAEIETQIIYQSGNVFIEFS
jgi:hypothetical protein